MISKKILIVSLFICILSIPLLAQPNLKWIDTQIAINPLNPIEGNQVTFSATFRCAREAASNVKVSAFIDGSQYYANKYASLTKGQDTLVTFKWPAVPGSHSIEFKLDPDNTLTEYYETDNNLQRDFTVTPKSTGSGPVYSLATTPSLTFVDKYYLLKKILPDLQPEIVVSKVTVAPNETNKFTIYVHNYGNSASTECKLYVRWSLKSGKHLLSRDDIKIPEIAKGDKFKCVVNWTDDTPEKYQITVIVDYFKVVVESNESNNSAIAYWEVK